MFPLEEAPPMSDTTIDTTAEAAGMQQRPSVRLGRPGRSWRVAGALPGSDDRRLAIW